MKLEYIFSAPQHSSHKPITSYLCGGVGQIGSKVVHSAAKVTIKSFYGIFMFVYWNHFGMFTSRMRANEQMSASAYPEVETIVRTLVIFQLPLAFFMSSHRLTSTILFTLASTYFALHPSAHSDCSEFNRVTSCHLNAYVEDVFFMQAKKRDLISRNEQIPADSSANKLRFMSNRDAMRCGIRRPLLKSFFASTSHVLMFTDTSPDPLPSPHKQLQVLFPFDACNIINGL